MRWQRRDERGAVTIVASVFTCFVLFGVAALVVDLGLARDTKEASQITSDASALAAATALYPAASTTPDFVAAVSAAKTYAQKNFGVASSDWAGCTDPTALTYTPDVGNSCISFDSTDSPSKVRVALPIRSVAAAFGGVYDATTYPIGTSARAVIQNPLVGDCGLCFLGGVSTNNSDFTVEAAAIAVNSDVTSGPNSYWTASSILIAGNVNGQDPDLYSSSTYTPSPKKISHFVDPYATLVLPSAAGLTAYPGVHSCNGSLQPGIYGSLSLGNNDTCTLNPGLYVITGAWSEGNNSMIKGTGVTLFFTCGSAASAATVRSCTTSDVAGTGGYLNGKNGDTSLVAGATAAPSFALIYDRLNPNSLSLQGNGGNNGAGMTGAVYAPNASMYINGNSKFIFTGGPVVVKAADGQGNPSGITVKNGVSAHLYATPQPPTLDQ